MVDKIHRLSLVAQYDDLVRNRAILTAGIETEFWNFVTNQDAWRKRFVELERAKTALTARTKELEEENFTLQTKLKHARGQIDHEITKRQKAEHDRDLLERQILLVRELLTDKNNATVLNEKDREKLAFLSVDFQSTLYEQSPRRILDPIEESGSLLSPSDISYDKTEEDLETPRRGRYKRPSAPPMEEDDDVTPPGKKSRRSHKNRHRRSKSADVITREHCAGARESVVLPPTDAIPERHRRNSSPAHRLMQRTDSQDEVCGNVYYKKSLKKGGASPTIDAATPELKRYNSGSSLTKPHMFESKTFYKQETCFACAKKMRFGKAGMKCKACFSLCHMECKDMAPLPCSAVSVTPNGPKNGPGILSDYTPTEPPMIPALIIHCVNEVESRGLTEIGIYRIPGSEREVKELKEKFLRGKGTPNLSTVSDIHAICGCLKDFLRSLKEPLITYGLWNTFINAAGKSDKHESLSDLYQAISQLPQPNRDTIAFLMLHLQRVAECADCKMSPDNLAMVFGPTVIGYSSPDCDAMRMISETDKQKRLIGKLLSISSDYWSKFVDCGASNSQMHALAGQEPSYRCLPKYDFVSGNPTEYAPPTLFGPITADQGHQEGSGQWYASRFGSSGKKPVAPLFTSPYLK